MNILPSRYPVQGLRGLCWGLGFFEKAAQKKTLTESGVELIRSLHSRNGFGNLVRGFVYDEQANKPL